MAGFGLDAKQLEECITERDKQVLVDAGGVGGVAAKLKTDSKSGLSGDGVSDAALRERGEFFGRNEFEYPPPKTFLQLCVDAMQDVTVRILIVASVISLGGVAAEVQQARILPARKQRLLFSPKLSYQ